MLMLSELLGFRVADEGGARARLDDLAVALLEGDYPPVTLLLYTDDDRRQRSLKWESGVVASDEKEIRVKDLGAGRAVAPGALADEVLLARDVLDALVLDLQNRRATRANDLALEEGGGRLHLRAADTSARALVRRLTRGLLFAGPPGGSLYDWKYVEFLRGDPSAVPSGAGANLRVARLQPGEIAQLASAVPYLHAAELLKLLPDPLAARTLELMSPERQLQVFEELDEGEAMGLLALMSPDDAADLVGRLETGAARHYLERLPRRKSAAVVELLRYPEDTAGGVMTNDVAFVASRLTAREARERLRGRLKETDFALLVYAVDDEEARRLRGLLSLRNLIVADEDARVEDFMDPYVTTLSPLEEAGAAARRVINSHMPALPVVGDDKRLLGVVTFEAAVMRAAPASWRAQAPRRVFS